MLTEREGGFTQLILCRSGQEENYQNFIVSEKDGRFRFYSKDIQEYSIIF